MMEKRTAISEALLISFLIVLMSPNISGYGYYEQDEYNNSQTDYNMTVNGGYPSPFESISWVTLPKRANITVAYLTMTGRRGYSKIDADLNSCGPFWNVSNPCTNIYDGNFSTFGTSNYGGGQSILAYYWFNYSKFDDASAGSIYYRDMTGCYEIDILSDCWTTYDNIIEFAFRSVYNPSGSEQTNLYCMKPSGWATMKDNFASGVEAKIYEKAIIWNTPGNGTYPSNVTIDLFNDGMDDYVNDTVFDTSEQIEFDADAINEYLRYNCSADFATGTCDIPLYFEAMDPGIIELSGLNVSGSYLSTNFTITAYDEETLGAIPFNITITNGTVNYNATNCSNPFTEPIEDLPNGAVTITVTSDGYISRTYFATFSQSAHTEVEAYLLSSGSGIYHSTFVLNGATDIPIEDALVTVQMDMGGYYATVEQHYTDTTGLALNFLDPLTQYHFVVTAEDYVSETYDIYPNPVSPVVYVRLVYTGIDGAEYINYSTMWDSISYQFLPDVYYHNDSFDVTFELSSSDNDITYQGMNVTYYNTTLVCDELVTTQPSGTTITCTIPFVEGQYRVEGYFMRANYSQHTFNPLYYWVYNSTASDISKIDMGAISDLGYFIVAILITMIVTAFASRFIGFGAGFLAIGLMAFFVALNPTLAIGGIPAWSIVGLMILAQLSLMVLRAYI